MGDACLKNKKSKQDSNDFGSDSDDIPLAFLGKRKVRRRLIHVTNESELDDSDDDENYMPSRSTSCESESDKSMGILTRKNRKIKREKCWQKKPTNVRSKRAKAPRSKSLKQADSNAAKRLRDKIRLLRNKRKSPGITSIKKAKDISERLHKIQLIVQQAHLSRLDNLLASNELKRKAIYGDGDCFFNALMTSGKFTEETIEMRTNLCEFMKANIDKYITFWAARTDSDASVQPKNFVDELEKMKVPGEWNNDIADIVPLAVANLYGYTLRIYSSSLSKPVMEIKPDQDSKKVINIAYTAIRGKEHYDATENINIHTERSVSMEELYTERNTQNANDQLSSEKDTESVETVETCQTVQSTPHKRAVYKSPVKKISSRKKKRNPEKWKKNLENHSNLKERNILL